MTCTPPPADASSAVDVGPGVDGEGTVDGGGSVNDGHRIDRLDQPEDPCDRTTALEAARAFADLFSAVYLSFHRRDGPRSGLTGASRAVLTHLALTGPLTIGEAAAHLQRAQSVVSEIVDHLERDQLLERERDPSDRRRTLIWLTPAGFAELEADRSVLSIELLGAALQGLCRDDRTRLLNGMRGLLSAATQPRNTSAGNTSAGNTSAAIDRCGERADRQAGAWRR